MPSRDQINASAAQYGYRLPTAAERAAQQTRMASVMDRVANDPAQPKRVRDANRRDAATARRNAQAALAEATS